MARALQEPGFASSLLLLKTSCAVLVVFTSLLTIAQSQHISTYLEHLDWADRLQALSLGALGLFEVLLPISVFVGCLLVFRRAWRCGYCLTAFSCGHSPLMLMRGLLVLALPLMFLTSIMAHSVGPNALQSLRTSFIERFESGGPIPMRTMRFGTSGGVEFFGDKGRMVGVIDVDRRSTLISAEASRFKANGDRHWLALDGVEINSEYLQMRTDHMVFNLPRDMVSAFPKILRGTKLLSSDALELNRAGHLFTYARRWCLVVSVFLLMLCAFVLPAYLSDLPLALVSVVILGSIQTLFRTIELSPLTGAESVAALVLYFCGLSVLVYALFYRHFLRA